MPIAPALFDATLAALGAVLPFERPADAVMSRFFREHPKLGARDRAFIAEAVFGMLRHLGQLRHLAGSERPRTMLLVWLARFQGVSARELGELAGGAEAAILAAARAMHIDSLPLPLGAELPIWVVERLRECRSDADILQLGRSMQQAAPLDLRVNTLKSSRATVLATLAAGGIAAAPTPYSPLGVRLRDKPAINRQRLFLEGHIEVQDEGSQLLGWLLAPQRRDMVVDFCAGAGGKTLMMAAMMQSQGSIYAFDISDQRLANIKARLERAGVSNVHVQRIAGENDLKVKRLTGRMDRVLVDAPCSGLGTLRRNPDLKWRQSPQSVAHLVERQSAILEAAARLVKPGGRLVYATCSLLPEENQQIVAAFTAAHADFQTLDAAALLAQQRIALDTGSFLELTPGEHGTDGFFAAALERAR